jgi:DNA-binding PadR family transcriptional regulator
MADRDFYSGLIKLHVLYHASKQEIFGLWMIRELRHHGYAIGPGTLYPMLHKLEKRKYLVSRERVVDGKVRRCYKITPRGAKAFVKAKGKVRELFEELFKDR